MRHVAVDAKDAGAVLRHQAKQPPVVGYVRARDWRFDFRRRDEFERQRLVSLLEGKAKNLCSRLIEHLRDDVALVLPDKEALAVKGRLGKPQVPGAFRGDRSGARLRI